mmetsp:Transcript_13837/g.19357  ORF Transcript_13837/g.19357 Transcript_13837/m.19357 type:complete len:423 (-) Transcript_13837:2232-3500(-)
MTRHNYLICLLAVGTSAFLTPQLASFPKYLQADCNIEKNEIPRHRFGATLDLSASKSSNVDDENFSMNSQCSEKHVSRRQRLQKKSSALVTSTAFALSILFQTSAQPAVARTAGSQLSLRPGVSSSQASVIDEGETNLEVIGEFQHTTSAADNDSDARTTESFGLSNSGKSSPKKETKKSKKSENDFDYGDEEDDTDFAEGFEFADTKRESVDASDNKEFAVKKKQIKNLNTKVGIAVGVPFFGWAAVRETIRWTREQRTVEKGIKIIEAQRAEYFNVTDSGNSTDTEIEDELKDLKGEDDDDDDDDGNDDDDNDDDNNDDNDNDPAHHHQHQHKFTMYWMQDLPLGEEEKDGDDDDDDEEKNIPHGQIFLQQAETVRLGKEEGHFVRVTDLGIEKAESALLRITGTGTHVGKAYTGKVVEV